MDFVPSTSKPPQEDSQEDSMFNVSLAIPLLGGEAEDFVVVEDTAMCTKVMP